MLPIIAGLLKVGLPILASAVMSKGQDVIQEKLGVDIGGLLGSEEGRLKLRELELANEVSLRKDASEAGERQVRLFQAEVADRDSARRANAAIAVAPEAGWMQRNLLPCMAWLVTLGFFGMLGSLFYLSSQKIQLDDNTRDVLIYALGVVSTGWTAIMAYLFGSSHGSRENQAAMAKLATRNAGAN